MNMSERQLRSYANQAHYVADLPCNVLVARLRGRAEEVTDPAVRALLREAAHRLAVVHSRLASTRPVDGGVIEALRDFLDRDGIFDPDFGRNPMAPLSEAVHQAAVEPRS